MLFDGVMRLTGRLAATSISVMLMISAGAATAQAEVVPVDPGRSVSAGKTIVGTGQNLPTINAESTWNIGPSSAALVNAYYGSGAALADQRDLAAAATKWSKKWLREKCGSLKKAVVLECKAAAVFDIDDTLLSSYPTLSTNTPAFLFSQSSFDAAATQCTATVIEPVKELYLSLQRMGVATVLLTGRGESLRDATANCLRQAGLGGWETLILRQAGDTDSASLYKAKARRGLVKAGWQIGPSVGDQISDMSYGALGRGFLVPNPMYLIP